MLLVADQGGPPRQPVPRGAHVDIGVADPVRRERVADDVPGPGGQERHRRLAVVDQEHQRRARGGGLGDPSRLGDPPHLDPVQIGAGPQPRDGRTAHLATGAGIMAAPDFLVQIWVLDVDVLEPLEAVGG